MLATVGLGHSALTASEHGQTTKHRREPWEPPGPGGTLNNSLGSHEIQQVPRYFPRAASRWLSARCFGPLG